MGRPAKRYQIPKDAPAAYCKSCMAPIYWVRSARGRLTPVNLDGRTHFATCPDAKRWSQNKDSKDKGTP